MKKQIKYSKLVKLKMIGLCVLFQFLIVGCTKDYIQKPTLPKPAMGEETDSLEASYVESSINSANASYWSIADYLFIDSIYNLNTGDLYPDDGLLNLTGTYGGISDFNNGLPVAIRLKAAYDNEYLYLLAEWEDDKVDISQKNWLWNGPSDPLKADSIDRWTSQGNDDKIAFAFDINGAVSGGKSFAISGCAASCHNGGGGYIMGPESGNVDIWNWSLALSEGVGYAFDMNARSDSGVVFDIGKKWFHRNNIDPDNYRSGPAYEWDGFAQDLSHPLGTPTILDPAWYLMNKSAFIGDPNIGETLYKNSSKGCEGCHGVDGVGNGIVGDGPPFDNADFSRAFSRQGLKDYAGNPLHEGKSYYDNLTGSQVNNLIAYIRGLAGVPGYYLEDPVPGESISDIETNSNLNLVKVNTSADHGTYKVLFKRKLDTGHSDDIAFDPQNTKVYPFGVALMDNDSKNHVGSLLEHLIFKN